MKLAVESRSSPPPLPPTTPEPSVNLTPEHPEPSPPTSSLLARLVRFLEWLSSTLTGTRTRCRSCGAEMRMAWEHITYTDWWTSGGTRLWQCPRCGATQEHHFVNTLERFM